MGNKIIVPDLNSDSLYAPASFRTAGFKWLVAVPLMTYRAHGLLGAASKNRKSLEKDTPDLIMVIAGLIANALSKSHLTGSFIRRSNKPPEPAIMDTKVETKAGAAEAALLTDTQTEIAPVTTTTNATPLQNSPPLKGEHPSAPPFLKSSPKKIDPAFHAHKSKMESFRKAHR